MIKAIETTPERREAAVARLRSADVGGDRIPLEEVEELLCIIDDTIDELESMDPDAYVPRTKFRKHKSELRWWNKQWSAIFERLHAIPLDNRRHWF